MSGRRLLAALVIAALVSATGIAAEKAWENERARVAEQRLTAARDAASQARFVFEAMIRRSAGPEGLAKRSGGIRRRGFRLFALRAIRQAGFAAVSWHPQVSAERRRTFERAIGGPIFADGPNGEPTRVGDHPFYLPLRLLEGGPPLEGGLRRRNSLGYDALSDPELARAARAARDSGNPMASGPTSLLGDPQLGLVAFRPVYQPGRPQGTPAARRRALLGVIGVSVPSTLLAEEIAAQLQQGETLEIEDSGVPLVEMPGVDADDSSVTADVAGRRWIVSVGGLAGPSELPAAAIFVAGLSLAILVGVLFAVAERREQQLERSRRVAERSAAREAMLVRVGDALERTVSVEGRLDEFARTIVPGLADICSIDLELGERGLRRVGVAAVDPRHEELIANLTPAQGIVREALEGGEVELVLDVDEELLREMCASEEEFQIRRSFGINSLIAAPLSARSRVLGVLTMYAVSASSRPPFGGDDAALAQEIADRAALAIDNARLYEEQLDIAQTLQRALLPRRLPQPQRLEVAARHRAGSEGTEVGGDFYDFFDGAGRWVAVIGDVCGKGAEAAALTGLVRHTLRASAEIEGPANALTQVDRAIYKETQGSTFCTLACASLELHDGSANGTVSATTAIGGHPEPLIVRRGGGVERVPRTGPLLGTSAHATFDQKSIELGPGDTLLLYTDGVTETRADGQLFGEERLTSLVERWSELPLDALLSRLESEVVRFARGHPQDDIALLAVRVLGA